MNIFIYNLLPKKSRVAQEPWHKHNGNNRTWEDGQSTVCMKCVLIMSLCGHGLQTAGVPLLMWFSGQECPSGFAISYSRGSSWPIDWICVSCIDPTYVGSCQLSKCLLFQARCSGGNNIYIRWAGDGTVLVWVLICISWWTPSVEQIRGGLKDVTDHRYL